MRLAAGCARRAPALRDADPAVQQDRRHDGDLHRSSLGCNPARHWRSSASGSTQTPRPCCCTLLLHQDRKRPVARSQPAAELDRSVPIAEPQAGGLLPGVPEPDGFSKPGVAQGIGEQGHAAAVLDRLQLLGIPGQDDLAPRLLAYAIRSARSGPDSIDASSITSKVPRPIRTGPRAPRRRAGGPGTARRCRTPGAPAARVLRADCDGVIPITGPSPAPAQIRAASASTRVFPDPAGALSTETSWPSVSAASAAAAWSSRSPLPGARPAARARPARVRPARPPAAPGPRRARARPPRGPGAARRPRGPA